MNRGKPHFEWVYEHVPTGHVSDEWSSFPELQAWVETSGLPPEEVRYYHRYVGEWTEYRP